MSNINSLADDIYKAVQTYSTEIDNKLQDEIKTVASEIKDELKSNPIIIKRSGKYKRGFNAKMVAQGRGYVRYVVANRAYQLTHLLERGHATKNGKRTRAFPHWQTAQASLDQKMAEVISKISEVGK